MSTIQHATVIRELVPLLFVEDIARSAEFYHHQLGFDLVNKWEPEGKLAWCRLERAHSAIMLQQAEAEDGPAESRGHGVGFFFHCDDADALHAELTDRGLLIDHPKVAFYGMKQVFLLDPDGYELCFQSPVESAATNSVEPICRT